MDENFYPDTLGEDMLDEDMLALPTMDNFVGDLMDGNGLVSSLTDYDEEDGRFELESWELDDDDGRPLDAIYRF